MMLVADERIASLPINGTFAEQESRCRRHFVGVHAQ
jgi:hypothetical protein